MTEKPIPLGNIDEQPQNRDWLRIIATQDEAGRKPADRAQDPDDTVGGNLSMTYLDPDDVDASWEALQRLIHGGETPDAE